MRRGRGGGSLDLQQPSVSFSLTLRGFEKAEKGEGVVVPEDEPRRRLRMLVPALGRSPRGRHRGAQAALAVA